MFFLGKDINSDQYDPCIVQGTREDAEGLDVYDVCVFEREGPKMYHDVELDSLEWPKRIEQEMPKSEVQNPPIFPVATGPSQVGTGSPMTSGSMTLGNNAPGNTAELTGQEQSQSTNNNAEQE
jgi:hypothetical protein